MKTQNLCKLLPLIITLLSNCFSQDDAFLDISIAVPEAAAITTYTFYLYQDITITIPANSLIYIEFPIQYQDVVEDGAHICTPFGWSGNPTLSCTMTGLSFQVSGGFPSQISSPINTVYTLIVKNIRNPIYAQTTSVFKVIFKDPDDNILLSARSYYGVEGVSITQGSMFCNITSTPIETSKSSAMIVTITPVVIIPYGTSMKLVLSKYWPTNAIDAESIFKQPGSCLPISNVSASITCTVDLTTEISITITNIVDLDTSDSISFSISPMINPPTTEPQGSITISSKFNGIYPMAKCPNNVIQGITPNQLEGVTYVVEDYTVNAITKAYLQFTVHSYIQASDSIVITFPSEISLTQIQDIFIVNTFTTDYTPSISGQSVTTEGATAIPMQTIQFQINNIINPSSQLPTSEITLEIVRNTYQVEVSASGALNFAARRGTLLASLIATNYQIGESSQYTFEITFVHSLTVNSLVIIYIPTMFSNSIDLGTTTCEPGCISLSKTEARIQYSSLSVNNGQTTIKLKSVINPVSVGASHSFQIVTLLDSSEDRSVVDGISTGLQLNFLPRTITSIALSSNSDIVFHSPTKISFTVSNEISIQPYSTIQIYLPPSITAYTDQVICTVGSNSISCNFDQSTRIITFSSISSVVIAQNSLPVVSLDNVFNPPSTKPTSTFKFYLLNPQGLITQQAISGLIYSIQTPASFSTFSLIPNNFKNSQETTLTVAFSISIQSGYTNLSLLVIDFPTQIAVSSAVCAKVSSNLLSLSCTKNSNQVKARLTFGDLSEGVETSFTISNFKNYPSIETFQISATLYVSSLEQYKISSGSLTLVNNQLSQIVINSYSFSQPTLSTSSSLLVQIVPAFNSFQKILITFPAQFSIGVPSCTLPSGLTCSIAGLNAYQIVPTASPYTFLTPITFTLNNINTPDHSPSTPITIQTISSTGFLMGQDITMIFETACSLPCKTCSSDPAVCLSCYTDSLLVSGKIILDNNECKSACSNKFYFDAGTNQCQSCSTLCELCVDSDDFCTSCPLNSYLYSTDNLCLSDCPQGFYEYANRCEECNLALNCKSCDNSFECLSCTAGYFFYQGFCLSSCPSPITYPNSLTSVCQSCPDNCTYCIGDQLSVTCTQCLTGYLLDDGGCYLECMTPGTVRSGDDCVSCSSVCYTCSISEFNCTQCDPGSLNPYFYQNRCLASCPDGFFQSSSQACETCTSPCQVCTSASVNACVSCISGYYLHGTSCFSECPIGFYEDIFKCSACVSPCQQCRNQVICQSCVSGQYLYGTRCVTECDPGMTVVNGNQCLVCDPSCKTCSTSSYCTSCYSSNYLYNGTCSIVCPDGTYEDSDTNSCLGCVSPCDQCSSSSYCQTCINTNLYVENGACVASCTSPLIPVNSICVSCDVSCKTCQTTRQTCIECAENYIYFQSTRTCSLTCDSYLYQNTTNTLCLAQCPQHYYPLINKTCVQCPTQCASCINSTFCQTCSLLPTSLTLYYQFYENFCFQKCPVEAQFSYQDKCYSCDRSLCLQCLNGTISCLTCNNGTFRILEQSVYRCISSCPNGYEYNEVELTCSLIPIITPNITNNTNNSNSSQNITNTTSGEFSFLSANGVPNFVFGVGGVFCGITIALSRVHTPSTNIISSLFAFITFMWLGSLGNILSYEVKDVISYLSESTSQRLLAESIIPLDNPTTILLMCVILIHFVGVLVTIISLVCIKDYTLKGIYEDHPIFAFFFTIFLLLDYRALWLLSTFLFGSSLLMSKYCKYKTVIVMKMGIVIGLFEAALTITYSSWILALIQGSTSQRLLLAASSLLQNNNAPYIQLIAISSILLILSVVIFFMNDQYYYINQTPSLGITKSLLHTKIESKLESENNQSMNQLISEKDALDQRFNQSQDLLVSQFRDEEILYGFGVDEQKQTEEEKEPNIFDEPKQWQYKEKMSKTAPLFFRKTTKKSEGSKKEQFAQTRVSTKKASLIEDKSVVVSKQMHDFDVQVNLDEMMLPIFEEEQLELEAQNKSNNSILNNICSFPKEVKNQNALPSVSGKSNDIIHSEKEIQSIGDKNNEEIKSVQQIQDLKGEAEDAKEEGSQPEWAQFKLGPKHRHFCESQTIYLGYVHEEGEEQILRQKVKQNIEQNENQNQLQNVLKSSDEQIESFRIQKIYYDDQQNQQQESINSVLFKEESEIKSYRERLRQYNIQEDLSQEEPEIIKIEKGESISGDQVENEKNKDQIQNQNDVHEGNLEIEKDELKEFDDDAKQKAQTIEQKLNNTQVVSIERQKQISIQESIRGLQVEENQNKQQIRSQRENDSKNKNNEPNIDKDESQLYKKIGNQIQDRKDEGKSEEKSEKDKNFNESQNLSNKLSQKSDQCQEISLQNVSAIHPNNSSLSKQSKVQKSHQSSRKSSRHQSFFNRLESGQNQDLEYVQKDQNEIEHSIVTSNKSGRMMQIYDSENSLLSENIPEEYRKIIQSRISSPYASYDESESNNKEENEQLEQNIPQQFIYKLEQSEQDELEENQNVRSQKEEEKVSKQAIQPEQQSSLSSASFYSETLQNEDQLRLSEGEQNQQEQRGDETINESKISSKFEIYDDDQQFIGIDEDEDYLQLEKQPLNLVFVDEEQNQDQKALENRQQTQKNGEQPHENKEQTQQNIQETPRQNASSNSIKASQKQKKSHSSVIDYQQFSNSIGISQHSSQQIHNSGRKTQSQQILQSNNQPYQPLKEEDKQNSIKDQILSSNTSQISSIPAPIIHRKVSKKDPLSLLAKIKKKKEENRKSHCISQHYQEAQRDYGELEDKQQSEKADEQQNKIEDAEKLRQTESKKENENENEKSIIKSSFSIERVESAYKSEDFIHKKSPIKIRLPSEKKSRKNLSEDFEDEREVSVSEEKAKRSKVGGENNIDNKMMENQNKQKLLEEFEQEIKEENEQNSVPSHSDEIPFNLLNQELRIKEPSYQASFSQSFQVIQERPQSEDLMSKQHFSYDKSDRSLKKSEGIDKISKKSQRSLKESSNEVKLSRGNKTKTVSGLSSLFRENEGEFMEKISKKVENSVVEEKEIDEVLILEKSAKSQRIVDSQKPLHNKEQVLKNFGAQIIKQSPIKNFEGDSDFHQFQANFEPSSIQPKIGQTSQLGASLLLIDDGDADIQYAQQPKHGITFIEEDEELQENIITPLPNKKQKLKTNISMSYAPQVRPSQLLTSKKRQIRNNTTSKQLNQKIETGERILNPFRKKKQIGRSNKNAIIYEQTEEDYGTIGQEDNRKQQKVKTKRSKDKKPSQMLGRHSFMKIGERIVEEN